MEKYSAFRDPGTGIQPFLTPLPTSGQDLTHKLLLPLYIIVGAAKTLLVVVLVILYVLTVYVLCLPLHAVPLVHRNVKYLFTALFSRLILLVTGLWWIPVELVNKKRGKDKSSSDTWSPKAGDIIVSNWVSWIEILWLAFRYDPIFLLPICNPPELPPSLSTTSQPISKTPGRRTGTGSAAISSPNTRTPTVRSKILGFQPVSLLSMLRVTGSIPPFSSSTTTKSLEDIRRDADRPLVIFPECTTSNGRGLLRFADVFRHERHIPVKGYNIYVMCVRYDLPTTSLPSLSHSIPSKLLNPLFHLFTLTMAIMPLTLSIRLLAPSESPSSGVFMLSDALPNGGSSEDVLSEVCANLIAQLGKMKRTGMGWEDKALFLEFYRRKLK